jgi:hypothetical protein
MDALFLVVAELLIVPLILWGLIVLELTVGVVASIVGVVLGKRSPTEAVLGTWRMVRKRLLWSLIFLSGALLVVDLLFFEPIVTLVLGSIDDREDLDLSFSHAEGSFILGRVELHQLALGGVRGSSEGEPTARFDLRVDTLVIDVDTARLLSADFAVEELALDGVVGSFDRLRSAPKARERGEGIELSREFSVERLHVGDMVLALRDHTREPAREIDVRLEELDIGPLHSETALFDLLYRARGRGSVAGHGFELWATSSEGEARTTLEIHDLPLDALGEQLEKAAGVRARGRADLTIVDTYSEGPPEPKVELAVALELRELELEAGSEAGYGAKIMLEMAERAIAQLGRDFPLGFEITLLRSELEGMRSLAEAGIVERVGEGIADALREKLRRGQRE